jgi:hypothetical protein
MAALTIRRWMAEPFGLQVVRVSVYCPGVSATTDVSCGDTAKGSRLTL